MKWRWFQSHWKHHPNYKQWIDKAHNAVEALWLQYKTSDTTTAASTTTAAIADESDSDDDSIAELDQLEQYERERRLKSTTMSVNDSPIPYWIGKLPVWSQLAQMALDIYSTPACSDEPERVFSMPGNVLNPRRPCLGADTVQELLCLRSWEQSGIITLRATDYQQAIISTEGVSINDELALDSTVDLTIEGDSDS